MPSQSTDARAVTSYYPQFRRAIRIGRRDQTGTRAGRGWYYKNYQGQSSMQFLKRLRVLTQLTLGFLTVIALLTGLGAFSLFEVNAENDHVSRVT